MTGLTNLQLNGTQISDDGVKHLARLSRLQRLDLSNTQISDDGVKKLKQALPNCRIVR